MIVEENFDLSVMKRRIKIAREEAGFTQVQLGDEIGETGNTISNWEMLKMPNAKPAPMKLRKLCIATNKTPGYFLGIETVPISSEEHELVRRYRNLNDAGKHTVMAVLESQEQVRSGSDG